jgi:hypothetical protein
MIIPNMVKIYNNEFFSKKGANPNIVLQFWEFFTEGAIFDKLII